MKIGKINFNKTWLVLGVALLVGLLAALLAQNYLSGKVAAIEAKNQKQMLGLIVASKDLPSGTPLNNENVAVREIPVDFAHSSAVLPEHFEKVEGVNLAYNVRKGEMILWSQLEGEKSPTFSARIAPGRRAVTVPVDEINSISGLLEPGDFIDLVLTVTEDREKIAVPIIQSVRVMATGQRVIDDEQGGAGRMYTTVTLDATPQEAEDVIIARDLGKITALLRNPEDREAVPSNGMDFKSFLDARKQKNTPALTVRQVKEKVNSYQVIREVPVMYGGSQGEIPPESLKLGEFVYKKKKKAATEESEQKEIVKMLNETFGSLEKEDVEKIIKKYENN